MCLVGGIDEAGRGSLFGPLVIAFFYTDVKNLEEVNSISVDSKKVSKKKREKIFSELIRLGKFEVDIISAQDLNILMKKYSLNEIEAISISNLIRNFKSTVYIDLVDRSKELFKKRLNRYGIIDNYFAEHKADEKYGIVGAASICAKVIRDREIEKLKEIIGDFGSGYPGDKKTKNFILNEENYYKSLPYLRHFWKTFQNLGKR